MARPEYISFARWNLPLLEDLFLHMQGQNVMLVDFHLRDLERDLLGKLHETDHPTFRAKRVVSALSQMWIFAVYELLRTWRQRIGDLKHGDQKPAVDLNFSALYYNHQLDQLRENPAYAEELDRAVNLMEPLFRRIEALRMNLAKHEVPGQRGVSATAPGWGRIDKMNGSVLWDVDLGNNRVDLVSRRSLADQLKTLVIDERMVGTGKRRSKSRR